MVEQMEKSQSNANEPTKGPLAEQGRNMLEHHHHGQQQAIQELSDWDFIFSK